ncbi:MAG: 4Fe-4S binding protein [Alphaproteobacteria bacterium]
MPLDEGAIRRGCAGAAVQTAFQLCRAETARFEAALSAGGPVTVGCTQEAPLFAELAGARGPDVAFANVRETGGWSAEATEAGPKMAALLAMAAEPLPPAPLVGLESEGVVLVYGRDARAVEAAELLKDHLDVTVMLSRPSEVAPRAVTEYPVVRGTIRAATGHLGAFQLTVDDFAPPAPSSRAALAFGPGRDGATSRCDIVLDLSGGPAMFPAADLRDGYLRADPGDPSAVLRAAMRARDLVGTFDKPRYVAFEAALCAHSRSRIVGCRRCLDVCPTGAIAPAGDHVAIDPQVCAGCGACSAVCPTGAASYALPPSDVLLRRLRTLLRTYHDAGGMDAVVLLHDDAHGGALIDALARHGDGVPARVLPVAVNEATQVGLEAIAAAIAYGASAVRVLLRGRTRHDVTGLRRTIALAEPILAGLGYAGDRVATIETDDPDALGAALAAIARDDGPRRHATFQPLGGKRDVTRLALRELHRVAPAPADVLALPEGAPFGTVEVAVEGCTLCLSCVAACPTGALADDPERPTLRFVEDACVQCGLCKATCPEKVVALVPQIDFRPDAATPRLLKQEEPFHCIRCAKPFGTRSTIERVAARLEGRHWMFAGKTSRADVIRMCEDCRVVMMAAESFDPYGTQRVVRTTDDYLREREEKG